MTDTSPIVVSRTAVQDFILNELGLDPAWVEAIRITHEGVVVEIVRESGLSDYPYTVTTICYDYGPNMPWKTAQVYTWNTEGVTE